MEGPAAGDVDLLSGVDEKTLRPSLTQAVQEAEVKELLEVMYPEGGGQPRSQSSQHAMPDGERHSSRLRNGRRQGGRSKVIANGELLTGADAEQARARTDRANRLLARAMSSGVITMGSGGNDFFQGFASPEAEFSPSKKSPSRGRMRTSPKAKALKGPSADELSKELDDLLASC
jgi:hypothetical protein